MALITPEENVCILIDDLNGDSTRINMEKSDEFLINHRGNTLHVRSYWPYSGEPSAMVVFMHGYASHVNRPTHKYLSEHLCSHNFAYITIDYYGHGYSDGLKGHIESESDCVDDTLSLIFALYSDKNETEYFKLRKNANPTLPFYLIGHSMGGGNAVLVSNLFTQLKSNASHTDFSLSKQEDILRLSPNFRGAVLLCPAIEVPKPPAVAVFVMSYILCPLFPDSPIPGLMGNSNDSAIWSDERYVKYVKSDQQPGNPEGLSWGGTMRFQTAYSILTVTEKVLASLPEMSFPFLALHDPEDKICFFKGAERLMAESATPSEHKTLVTIEGGCHDLLANRLGFVTETIVDWIEARQALGALQSENSKVVSGADCEIREGEETTTTTTTSA